MAGKSEARSLLKMALYSPRLLTEREQTRPLVTKTVSTIPGPHPLSPPPTPAATSTVPAHRHPPHQLKRLPSKKAEPLHSK